MRRLSFSFLITSVFFTVVLTAQQRDRSEIHHKALETGARLEVLSLSLKPGFEDFSALAYLKHVRGARITSVYFTNGENSESDLHVEFPNERAATLRQEAWESMTALGAETYFLNAPDFGFSEDSTLIRDFWPSREITDMLGELIRRFRPDLIIVPTDADARGASLRWRVMRDHVLLAVREKARQTHGWDVGRVLADDGTGKGEPFPHDAVHPLDGTSLSDRASQARSSYRSLAKHSSMRGIPASGTYQTVFPSLAGKGAILDSGLPGAVSSQLRSLERSVKRFCSEIQQHAAKNTLTQRQRSNRLKPLADLIDSVQFAMSNPMSLNQASRRVLLGWNEGLEELKNLLLGARLEYRVSDYLLVKRQLTYLQMDSLEGESKGGTTSVYFPAADQNGWIVDETWNKQFPFRAGDPYRLVSPEEVTLSVPYAVNGLSTNEFGSVFWFLVIHQAPERERSFVIKVRERFFFTPKLSIELLTPIVRVNAHEHLRVRFTNFSRDSFGDVFNVQDSLIHSAAARFRLGDKDTSAVMSLPLHWERGTPSGNYVIPFKLGEVDVGLFLARAFPTLVDTSKRVNLLSSGDTSVLERTLMRMGIEPHSTENPDVFIVDHRALTIEPGMFRDTDFRALAHSGTHVIVLSQDSDVWNQNPLIQEITLKHSESLDARTLIHHDSIHSVFAGPNKISASSWSDWLNERAKHTILTDETDGFETIVRGPANEHLAVTRKVGRGRMTYVALSLQKQLLNIHEGSFQFLANLISY